MQKNSLYAYYLLLAWTIIIGCKQSQEDHSPHDHSHAGSPDSGESVAPETMVMIDSIRKAQEAVDPMKVLVILAPLRAKLYEEQASKSTGLQKANFMVQHGFEELKAGNSKRAIEIFESVLTYVEPLQIPGKEQTVHEVKKDARHFSTATW